MLRRALDTIGFAAWLAGFVLLMLGFLMKLAAEAALRRPLRGRSPDGAETPEGWPALGTSPEPR